MPVIAARSLPPPRRRLLVAALALVASLMVVDACSPLRLSEAVAVLGDIAAGSQPSQLKRITSEPSRTAASYEVEGRRHAGDLYQPLSPTRATLVVVPGLTREGKDDARLVAFATTMARARFRVLVPDIVGMRALRASAADADDIADAVRYLRDAPPKPGGVGLVAFSYAVGPAVLAALAPDLRDSVRFIVAIGGYYDIETALAFATTGYFRDDATGEWRFRAPNAYGKWLILRSNADRLSLAADRDRLAAIADRKMAQPDAPVEDLVAGLGAEGRAVYALAANRSPDAVPSLIAALPAAIREDLRALDLKRYELSQLSARLIAVHGRNDAVIPFGESLKLARAVPPGHARTYLVDSLAHVDLGPSGLADALTLLSAVYRLLAARDACFADGPAGD